MGASPVLIGAELHGPEQRMAQADAWLIDHRYAKSALDTALFFSLAFSAALSPLFPAEDVAWATAAIPLLGIGPLAPLWVSLATADFAVKLTLALLALAPFRALSSRYARAAG